MKPGFDEYLNLSKKLEGVNLPIELDYVKKYMDKWTTAIFYKEGSLEVKTFDNDNVFARFTKDEMITGDGNYVSPLNGREYLFGREPLSRFGGNLYFLSIEDGDVKKRETDVMVFRNFSRIHLYVKDLGDEIKFSRIGITPVNIEDEEGNVVLF